MIIRVNKFRASIIQEDRFKQPDFDYSVDFSCQLDGGKFIVYAENLTPEKLAELQNKYEWLGEEDKEVPDPVTMEFPNG